MPSAGLIYNVRPILRRWHDSRPTPLHTISESPGKGSHLTLARGWSLPPIMLVPANQFLGLASLIDPGLPPLFVCPACPASAFHPFSCLSPSPASRMCLMVSHCPCSPLVYHHSTYQLLYRSTPRCLTPLRHVTHFHFHLTKGFARTYFRDPSSSLVSSSCDALDYASVRCCRFPVIRYLWIYCITILRSVPS